MLSILRREARVTEMPYNDVCVAASTTLFRRDVKVTGLRTGESFFLITLVKWRGLRIMLLSVPLCWQLKLKLSELCDKL